MDTLVLEHNQRVFLTQQARVVHNETDVDSASEWDLVKANPFLTYIAGDFVEGDKPNSNGQMWTGGDLREAEYSIRYAPLNMVHKVRQPVGVFLSTRVVEQSDSAAEEPPGSMRIQALSGLWSHIFPFENALVEQADDNESLFYSMECRAKHIQCHGDQGCGQTFDYMAVDEHCEHLKDRASNRLLINPTFRGGALIIPPVRPGWQNAKATVYEDAIAQEAARFAEQTQEQHASLSANGADLSASAWEQLMASIVQLAHE